MLGLGSCCLAHSHLQSYISQSIQATAGIVITTYPSHPEEPKAVATRQRLCVVLLLLFFVLPEWGGLTMVDFFLLSLTLVTLKALGLLYVCFLMAPAFLS